MLNTKLLASILFAVAVMFAQVDNVAAAPQMQDTTPITDIIQSIATETDANGVTTVLVTIVDEQGATQTVRLSVDIAEALGLITVDPTTNEPVVGETQIGQLVEIDPTTVIPDEDPTEEAVHPIAALLANFFDEDPSVVNGYHENGFGFGVIAQAMWMSESINGDASAAGLVLEAKRSGDYSAFELPDGSSPTNWGQFKKAIMQKGKKNLGIIVSGHADDSSEDSATQEDHGNGKNKEKKQKKDKKNHP
jgi:hypothetical protein